jgi:hypothetical protein
MSLFGRSTSSGGGLFSRASEADLVGAGTATPGRPTPPGQHRGQAYTAQTPADEAARLRAQIGPADRALEFGFRARGGVPPSDVVGAGAERRGAGRR